MVKRCEDMSIILMVGNAEVSRVGIKRLLEMDGYRVVIAAEEEAVASARRQRPDLLLVDLGQPPFETVAAARRIRRRASLTRNVPIVALPVPMPGSEGSANSLRHNVHVTYVIEFKELENLLSRLLDERAVHANGH
jgi:CheY-like chemotaxis protein